MDDCEWVNAEENIEECSCDALLDDRFCSKTLVNNSKEIIKKDKEDKEDKKK